MFFLLADIPGYRLFGKLERTAATAFTSAFEDETVDRGLQCEEIQAGRWLIWFREGVEDPGFVVETSFALFDLLRGLNNLPLGYGLVLEDLDQPASAAAGLVSLLLKTHEREGFWLGPRAALTLAPLIRHETHQGIARVLSKIEFQGDRPFFPHQYEESFLSAQEGVERCSALLGAGIGALFLESARPQDLGTLVERIVAELLGPRYDHHYVWVQGNVVDEYPTTALCRYLQPAYLDEVGALVDESDRQAWATQRAFLAPPGPEPHMFSLEENAAEAWLALMAGVVRLASLRNIPAVIVVENADQLHGPSRQLIERGLEFLASRDFGNILLIVTQPNAGLRSLPALRRHDFWHIDRAVIEDLDVEIDPVSAAMRAWLVARKAESPSSEWAIQAAVLASLSALCREFYYVVVLGFGLLDQAELTEFFLSRGLERVRIPPCFKELYQHGLLRSEDFPVPVFAHSAESIETFVGEESETIRLALRDFLQRRLSQKQIPIGADVFSIGIELFDDRFFLDFGFQYGGLLIDARLFAEADRVIDHVSVRSRDLTDETLRQKYAQAVAYLHARSLLNTARTVELSSVIGHLQQLGGGSPEYGPYLFLQQARWYYLRYDLDQAHGSVKHAILGFQDNQNQRGRAAAQSMFGLVLLGQGKPLDGREYFLMARASAVGAQAAFDELLALWLDLSVLFLTGYYSRVLKMLHDEAGVAFLARRSGLRELSAGLRFLEFRVLFELGQYADAQIGFGEIAHESSLALPALTSSARAWEGRSRVHRGLAWQSEAEASTSFESQLTLIEDCLIREDFVGGLQKLRGLNRLPTVPLPEAFFTDDGFVSLEGRLAIGRPGFGVVDNLLAVYTAYCEAFAGEIGTATQTLFDRLRIEGLVSIDPYAHIYLFLYSRVLRLPEAPNLDDANTMLGRAVKVFQERASRIEEPAHKQAYMRMNRWNAALVAEAKEHNLA